MPDPTPLNTDIDPRASQRVAAQQRQRPTNDERRTTTRRKLPIVPIAVVGTLLALALLFTRLPSVPPMQITPTEAAQALSAPRSTPMLSPSPTIAPSASPEPSQEPLAGRGLTVNQVALEPEPPTPDASAPSDQAKPVGEVPVEIPIVATRAPGAIAQPGLGQCLHGQVFTDQGCKNPVHEMVAQ